MSNAFSKFLSCAFNLNARTRSRIIAMGLKNICRDVDSNATRTIERFFCSNDLFSIVWNKHCPKKAKIDQ